MIVLLFQILARLDRIELQIAAAAARQTELELTQQQIQGDVNRLQDAVRAKTSDQAQRRYEVRSKGAKKIVLRKIDFSQSTTATYLRGIMNNPSSEGK